MRVTRNTPPKRATVNPGCTVRIGAEPYYGIGAMNPIVGLPVTEADAVLGDGATLDSLESLGYVTVEEQTPENVEAAIAAWNGKEGAAIRKAALKHIDGHYARLNAERAKFGLDPVERDHDHGFVPYEDADEQGEMDVSSNRRMRGYADSAHAPDFVPETFPPTVED